jgi:outer membrane immunogenic protein
VRGLMSFVAAIALAGLAQSAAAAEPPAFNQWSGWYAGVAAGAGWGTAEQTDTSIFGPFTSGRYDTSGPLLGISAGYNWQTGMVVLGAEADLSWAAIKGAQRAPAVCFNSNCSSEIQALGTLRGRLGLAWGDWLPYVTGGLAYADLHGSEGPLLGTGGSGSTWASGYTIGGGAEVKLASRWSAKFEYLFVDLGKHEVWTNNLGLGVFARENLDVTAHIVRLGLNYQF